jgi:hypothetical protein
MHSTVCIAVRRGHLEQQPLHERFPMLGVERGALAQQRVPVCECGGEHDGSAAFLEPQFAFVWVGRFGAEFAGFLAGTGQAARRVSRSHYDGEV